MRNCCRSCDFELLEHTKNVTLTMRLLRAAEIVSLRLNGWRKKLTDGPTDRPNNKKYCTTLMLLMLE